MQQNNFCVSSNLKAQVPCPIISHMYQLVTNAMGHQMITKWLPSGHQNVHQLVNDVTMISLVYQVVTRETKEELERRFEEILYKMNKWRVQEKTKIARDVGLIFILLVTLLYVYSLSVA